MNETRLGVVAVGNALVDVLSKASDAFIQEQCDKHGMQKGAMTLIDEMRAVELYSQMGPGVETSGGSAGNTMAGFASFGGKGGFIGKVAQDELGKIFQHDMRAQGLIYDTQPLVVGSHTGRCLILVSDDGQRTMNTFLGASVELSENDIDEELIASALVTYLEGYLFDRPLAKKAFFKSAEAAHAAKRKVALTLSDPFCVDRHRDDFRNLVQHHIDILFANEEEIKSLYRENDFNQAIKAVSSHVEIAVVTRGPQGAVVAADGKTHEIPAQPVKEVIDTTGAGDQFAAGFLFGYTSGMNAAHSGRLGALAAAEVISHIGPRPQTPYETLLDKAA